MDATTLVRALIVSAVCAMTSTAEAARSVVAVFPFVAQEEPSEGIIKAINAALLATKLDDATLLSGAVLKQKLRQEPRVALSKCEEDIRCIQRLAAKVQATEMVLGRLRDTPDGVIVTLVALKVEGGAVFGKQVLPPLHESDARDIVRAGLSALLGRSVVVDPSDIPLEAPLRPSASAPVALQPAPLDATQRVQLTRTSPAIVSTLRYGGLALAGGAVVALIAAVACGSQASTQAAMVGPDTSQLATLRYEANANGLVDIANVLYIVSGVTVAVGGALFGTSFLVGGPKP